jgi:hypothetical protein
MPQGGSAGRIRTGGQVPPGTAPEDDIPRKAPPKRSAGSSRSHENCDHALPTAFAMRPLVMRFLRQAGRRRPGSNKPDCAVQDPAAEQTWPWMLHPIAGMHRSLSIYRGKRVSTGKNCGLGTTCPTGVAPALLLRSASFHSCRSAALSLPPLCQTSECARRTRAKSPSFGLHTHFGSCFSKLPASRNAGECSLRSASPDRQ